MNAIEINNLTKLYGERVAVNNLNLEIKNGELFSLLGLNGAGKTTTIKMLSCLLEPNNGDAVLLGDSIKTSSLEVKKKINVSPQETAVAPNLSVLENLYFVADIYEIKNRDKRVNEMLNLFSLEDRKNDKAKKLSGGLQRRLSIAMALLSNPKILFLDEPTLGLDVRARRDLWKIIGDLKGKVTILLTTHYLEEAEALCDRLGVMNNGNLVFVGTSSALKKETKTDNIEEAFLKITEGEI